VLIAFGIGAIYMGIALLLAGLGFGVLTAPRNDAAPAPGAAFVVG